MKVVFTRAAEGDLESIGDFIARDNPKRAGSFLRELRQAATDDGKFPEGFQLVARRESHGIRRRPFGAYLVFYSVMQNHITIVRILHGAQDYEAILFPEA